MGSSPKVASKSSALIGSVPCRSRIALIEVSGNQGQFAAGSLLGHEVAAIDGAAERHMSRLVHWANSSSCSGGQERHAALSGADGVSSGDRPAVHLLTQDLELAPIAPQIGRERMWLG